MMQEENCQNKIERFVRQRRSLPCAFQETDVGNVARLGGTIRFGNRGRGKIHAGDAGYVRGQEKLQIPDAAADAEYSRSSACSSGPQNSSGQVVAKRHHRRLREMADTHRAIQVLVVSEFALTYRIELRRRILSHDNLHLSGRSM